MSEPTPEMVERVARVMWDDADDSDFDSLGPETQKRLRNRARLVLAAMREPTESMVEAGWNATGEADATWRAMLDAAGDP